MVLQVFQSGGRLMIQDKALFIDSQTYLNLGRLTAVLYIMVLRDNEGKIVFRIILLGN